MVARLDEDPDSYSIPQKDDTVFHGYRRELYKSFFLFWLTCTTADAGGEERPATPPLMHAIANAVDREQAMDTIWPEWRSSPPKCAFQLEALVQDGELIPDMWAAGMLDELEDEDED